MAEKEIVRENVTCTLCGELYTEPKVFPCCHYYCKQCIYNLASKTGSDKPFPCPVCDSNTTLPQGSADSFPTAFFVNHLKRILGCAEANEGKADADCEVCSDDRAKAICDHCGFVCANCSQQHGRMKKVFLGHTISSLEEFGKLDCLQTCKLHHKPMMHFCNTCGILICLDCTTSVNDHHGHDSKLISVAVLEKKKELTRQLNLLKETNDSISCLADKVRDTKTEIEKQVSSVTNDISRSCDKFHKTIDDRKEELVAEVEERAQRKLDSLANQERDLLKEQVKIQNIIDYVGKCIRYSTDTDVMYICNEIQSLQNRLNQERKSTEVEAEPDIGLVSCSVGDFKKLFHITQCSLDPTKCTVTLDVASPIEVNKAHESELILEKRLSNGMETQQPCSVQCQLKSLANGHKMDCQVCLEKDNTYSIKYTPVIRGRHQLIISLNGQEIVDSPFPIFVSIDPTQLDKPVRVITGDYEPWDISINSVNNIIFTESHSLIQLDASGNQLERIKASSYNIGHFMSVTVDEADDCIYLTGSSITSDTDNKIIRLGRDLKLLNERCHEDSMLGGVAVIGDRVLVCDYKNGRVIAFDKELKLLDCQPITGLEKKASNRDLSGDQFGKLYVTDCSNSCVHIFSSHWLGYLEKCRVDQLAGPRGICVAGQYIYVANYDSKNVSVLTTDGRCVASFGCEGCGEGEFQYPWGVCVDRDGFVYVCDNQNGIQIF